MALAGARSARYSGRQYQALAPLRSSWLPLLPAPPRRRRPCSRQPRACRPSWAGVECQGARASKHGARPHSMDASAGLVSNRAARHGPEPRDCSLSLSPSRQQWDEVNWSRTASGLALSNSHGLGTARRRSQAMASRREDADVELRQERVGNVSSLLGMLFGADDSMLSASWLHSPISIGTRRCAACTHCSRLCAPTRTGPLACADTCRGAAAC